MGLSARELLLIMRAKDEISGTLSTVGRNMVVMGIQTQSTFDALRQGGMLLATTGAAITTAGVAMAGFLKGSTDAAAEYSREAALTLTQAQRTGASLEDIKRIGLSVGKDVPVAFDNIQASLYDIFSTVDTTVPQAEMLLRAFATAAVAGQADIQDVSRLTMGVMNAYKMPLEDVNKVLDTQFRLVELGAGTYDEFVQSLGRNVPTAVAAGQSFETLSAAMAFLTRQGVPVANASAAVGRAFEMLSAPKAVRALQDLGVQVTDNNGRFLQFNDIITQLAQSKGWAEMTEPDRKVWFKEIFGTGTIQARRFFDVAIPNFELFNRMANEMNNSAGAVQTAFGTMFGEPAMQAQLLSNRWAAFRIEIGEKLIPVMLKAVTVASDLLKKWDGLSEGTKDLIVKIAAIATAVALVVGPIMMFVGALLMFIGIAAPLVGGLGTLAAIMLGLPAIFIAAAGAIAYVMTKFEGFKELIGIKLISLLVSFAGIIIGAFSPVAGAILAVFATLITAGYLLYRHWDDIKALLVATWNGITAAWDALVSGFQGGNSKTGILGVFEDIGRGIAVIWPKIQSILNEMENGFVKFWDVISGLGSTAWDGFVKFVQWLWNDAGPKVIDAVQSMWDKLVAFSSFLADSFGGTILGFIEDVTSNISDFVQFLGSTVVTGVTDFSNKIVDAFQAIYDKSVEIKDGIQNFGTAVVDAFQSLWDKTEGLRDFIANLFGPSIQEIWTALQENGAMVADELGQTWDVWKENYNTVKDAIVEASQLMQDAWRELKDAWNEASDTINESVDEVNTKVGELTTAVGEELRNAWEETKDALSNGWQDVIDAWTEFKDAFDPLLEELKQAWTDLKAVWNEDVVPALIDAKNQLVQAWNELKAVWVEDIWPELKAAYEEFKVAWQDLKDAISKLAEELGISINLSFIGMVAAIVVSMVAIVTAIITAFTGILLFVTATIQIITQVIVSGITVIANNIALILNILQGDWEGAWNNILNIVRTIWDLIYQVISSILNLIVALFKLAMSLIGVDFSTAMNSIAALATSGMQRVFSAINNGIQQLLNLFRSLPGQIQGMFSGAITWLVNAGQNIVQGLINGLQSKIPSLRSMASSIAGIVKSAVGSFLGINSPSTVMFEMGEMTALGFELGVLSRSQTLANLINGSGQYSFDNFTPSLDTNYDPKSDEMLNLMQRLVTALEDPKSRGLYAESINVGSQDDIIELDDWARRRFSGG